MVEYCNDGWIVVLAYVSVAVGIRKIFYFICKLCGGMCVVGIVGGVNDGCGGSSLAHHNHHQQQYHQHNNHRNYHLHHHLHHHLNYTAYT